MVDNYWTIDPLRDWPGMNGQMPAAGSKGVAHDQWWAAMLAAAPAHMLERAASVASTVRTTVRPAIDRGAQQACPMQQDGGANASTCSPAAQPSANGVPPQTRVPQTKPPSPASDDGPDDDEEDSSNGEREHAAPPTEKGHETVREQDRFLPIANVAKVMTRQLSSYGHAKIAHDAKMDMQECVTEFICFIMSQSNDSAVSDKRKTVTGIDIANSCREMGKPPPCPKRNRIWSQRFTYVPSIPLQIFADATSHSAWRSSSCSLSSAVGAGRPRTTRQTRRSGVDAASRTRSTSGSASQSSCTSLPPRRPPRIRPPARPVTS